MSCITWAYLHASQHIFAGVGQFYRAFNTKRAKVSTISLHFTLMRCQWKHNMQLEWKNFVQLLRTSKSKCIWQQFSTVQSLTNTLATFQLHMTGVFQANLICWYSTNRDGEVLLGNAGLYSAHSGRSHWNTSDLGQKKQQLNVIASYYAQKENNKMPWMLNYSVRLQLWHSYPAGAQVTQKSELPCLRDHSVTCISIIC